MPGKPTPKARAVPAENGPGLSVAEMAVARRVSALRAEVGLTLRELGARAGLSEAYLSRVENGQTAVTIGNLARLASALGVPLETFFRSSASRELVVVTRAGEGTPVRFRGADGYLARLLARDRQGKLMEPIVVDVASAKREVPLQGHPGEEFMHVLEGRCEVRVGADRHTLAAGDSIYFDATLPHTTVATGPGPCRVLSVVTSRDYPLHDNIAVLLDDPEAARPRSRRRP
jgi:transcriptional regulator with XRE-family HTH domain